MTPIPAPTIPPQASIASAATGATAAEAPPAAPAVASDLPAARGPSTTTATGSSAPPKPESAAEQRAMRLEAQTLTPADVARLDGMPLPTLLTIHQLSEAWRARKSKLASLSVPVVTVQAAHAATAASATGSGPSSLPVGPAAHRDLPGGDVAAVAAPQAAAGQTAAATLAAGATTAALPIAASASAAAITVVSTSPHAAGALAAAPPSQAEAALTGRALPQPEVAEAGSPTQRLKPKAAGLAGSTLTDGVQLLSAEDKHRYGFHNQPSVAQQVHLLFWRQVKLTTRNRGYVLARWINALLIGLIVSTVAFGGSSSSVQLRVSHRDGGAGRPCEASPAISLPLTSRCCQSCLSCRRFSI